MEREHTPATSSGGTDTWPTATYRGAKVASRASNRINDLAELQVDTVYCVMNSVGGGNQQPWWSFTAKLTGHDRQPNGTSPGGRVLIRHILKFDNGAQLIVDDGCGNCLIEPALFT